MLLRIYKVVGAFHRGNPRESAVFVVFPQELLVFCGDSSILLRNDIVFDPLDLGMLGNLGESPVHQNDTFSLR